MRIYKRPIKGCTLYATREHFSLNHNQIAGEVVNIDGNLLKFRDLDGDIQTLIWRTKDGLNKFYKFGA